MERYTFGDPAAEILLIQMVDAHDLEMLNQEISHIRRLSGGIPFCLEAVKVQSWNRDLSPWNAPAVFGNADFGIAAASPSVWFPHFTEYMREHEMQVKAVYLSLGDREEKTRNPVMARVGECIREAHDILTDAKKHCMLEWNAGNHFKDPDLRTAKAFAWLMQEGANFQLQDRGKGV